MAFMVPTKKKEGKISRQIQARLFYLPEVALRADDELREVRNIILVTSSYTLLIVCTDSNLGNIQ